MKCRIDTKEKVVIFMAEHLSYLQCRLEVGRDGKTAYERVMGKSGKVLGIEFGEKGLWKIRSKSSRLQKIRPRWEYGIFVGVKPRSGELLIATTSGTNSVRSVRRIPVEERWTPDTLKWVKHVPRHKCDGDPAADGDLPEEVRWDTAEVNLMGGQYEKVVIVSTKESKPRGIYVTEKNIIEHGPTRGCGGCTSIMKSTGRQPHNEACRSRFSELLKHEAKVKNADMRRKAVEDKAGVCSEEPLEKKRRGDA